ncbi:RING-H2 finger protein ATL32 [Cocos nucifera]|uniref:RING-type E3 ubiquitin transferase n=1 Tax=Cocos nucifera TaxID=13894 RepID=A0A8K0HYP7_COCNU|nr:RING-H2 finger protein ATL32 [Cocos nucifera]
MEEQTGSCCSVVATLVLLGIFLGSCIILFIVFFFSRSLLESSWHDRATAGLDRSTICALPTFAYRRATCQGFGAGAKQGTSAECAVCISVVEDGEEVRLLPNCKHVFHVQCIDMWLYSHSTCPLCRTAVEPKKMAKKVVAGEVDLAATAV